MEKEKTRYKMLTQIEAIKLSVSRANGTET